MPKTTAPQSETLTTFKRDTAAIAARLKKTGRPLVLTVNGEAELVVLDAAAYQQLVDRITEAERSEMRAFLDAGFADLAAGRTRPALEALDAIADKYKLRRAGG